MILRLIKLLILVWDVLVARLILFANAPTSVGNGRIWSCDNNTGRGGVFSFVEIAIGGQLLWNSGSDSKTHYRKL
jgi:hypothetical protein